MDIVLQVLGTFGLIETVVEFTYVLTNRDNFTTFEEVFFLTSGCIEMLGEVVFLLVGITIFFQDKDCKGVRALVQDPVHNLAKAIFDEAAKNESETNGEYVGWSLIAIFISVLSLPVWATFWPVWGGSFDGDGDDGLRLALSICSLALIYIWILISCKEREISLDQGLYVLFIMYAIEKVFEEYILLSDLERLCPGDLGKALVAFQLAEIMSVAFILACFVWENCVS